MGTVRFTLDEIKKMKGVTDKKALDAMTEEELIEAANSDPDCPILSDEDLKQFRRVVPKGDGTYGHHKSP